MNRQVLPYLIAAVLGLSCVGCAYSLFPDTAAAHPLVFILAAVLIIVFLALLALKKSREQLKKTVSQLKQERQLYRDALLHDCDYAYIVNVSTNKIHDTYKGGFLENYGFRVNAPYDESMSRVVENMHPIILYGMPEMHLRSHYLAAYAKGERMMEVKYYIQDQDIYKRKTLFLSKSEDDEMYVFVVAHDITKKQKEELETERALMDLADTAQKIGSGQLDVKIDVNAPGLIGILASVLDQTILNLKWHIDNLKQLSTRDPLTKVKNQLAWQTAGQELDATIRAGNARFAIVICDVNGLKKVNDTLGHQAGDSLIIRASRHICRVFKHSPVYRIGGDEFAVVLTGTDLDECENLLHTFQHTMAGSTLEAPTEIPISIAIGISHYQTGDTSFSEVFHRADTDMYKTKMSMKKTFNDEPEAFSDSR